MRRAAPRPISLSVEALADRLAPRHALARVQRVWVSAVGAAVAREADPLAVHERTLTVGCRSAVWAQELDLMGPELLQALNQALGGPVLERLRCRVTGGHATP
jgi:predicted nucleic acid-binding Zn ribbon protein